MLYKLPKDITYTQMAIWIDEHAYEDDVDEELLFEYLYHLSMMLARKARYFKDPEYLEMFAVELATAGFMRLHNRKQYIYDEHGNPKMSKLKSILNYLKVILYPRKVEFEQNNYAQTDIPAQAEETEDLTSGYTFANLLQNNADDLFKVDFKCCLETIINTIQLCLKDIPYKYKSTEWNNIYISCLLSFLNSITLSNDDFDRIKDLKFMTNKLSALNHCFDNYRECVILFHLPESMRDYIQIQTTRIRHALAKDLTDIINTEIDTHSLSSSIIKKEINSDYSNEVI